MAGSGLWMGCGIWPCSPAATAHRPRRTTSRIWPVLTNSMQGAGTCGCRRVRISNSGGAAAKKNCDVI